MSDGKIVFEKNKVFNADCFDLIEVMPNDSLDLVIVDPPYGDGIGYGRNGKEILNNEDESINYRFLDAVLPKMKQDTSLYLFSNHKFVNQIKEYATENGYNYRMLCIMVKNNIGMGYGFRNQYEVCLVLEKGKVHVRKRLPLSLTVDYRAVDGAPAAKFLDELISLLEKPKLFMEKKKE